MNENEVIQGLVNFSANGLDNILAAAQNLDKIFRAVAESGGKAVEQVDRMGAVAGKLEKVSASAKRLAKDMSVVTTEAKVAKSGLADLQSFVASGAISADVAKYIAEKGNVGPSAQDQMSKANAADLTQNAFNLPLSGSVQTQLKANATRVFSALTQNLYEGVMGGVAAGVAKVNSGSVSLNAGVLMSGLAAGAMNESAVSFADKEVMARMRDASGRFTSSITAINNESLKAYSARLRSDMGEPGEIGPADMMKGNIRLLKDPYGEIRGIQRINKPMADVPNDLVGLGNLTSDNLIPKGLGLAVNGQKKLLSNVMQEITGIHEPWKTADMFSDMKINKRVMPWETGLSGRLGRLLKPFQSMWSSKDPDNEGRRSVTMWDLMGRSAGTFLNADFQRLKNNWGAMFGGGGAGGGGGGGGGKGFFGSLGGGEWWGRQAAGAQAALGVIGNIVRLTANFARTVVTAVTGFRVLHEVTSIALTGLRSMERVATSVLRTLGNMAKVGFHAVFNAPLRSLYHIDDKLRKTAMYLQQSPITRVATILSFGALTGTGEMFGISSVVRRSFTRLVHGGLAEVTKSNEWATFGKSITDLMRALMDGLAPFLRIATDLVRELTDAWNGLDQETKNAVLRWGMLVVAFSGMVALLPTTISMLGGLFQVFDLILKPLDLMLTAIGNLMSEIIQFSITAVSSFIRVGIAITATLTTGILSIIGLMGQLVVGVLSVAASLAAMGLMAIPVLAIFAPLAGGAIAIGLGLVASAFKSIGVGAQRAWQWVQDLWTAVNDFAAGAPGALNAMAAKMMATFNAIKANWKQAFRDMIGGAIDGWNNTFLPGILNTFQAIGDAITVLVWKITSEMERMYNNIAGLHNNIHQQLNAAKPLNAPWMIAHQAGLGLLRDARDEAIKGGDPIKIAAAEAALQKAEKEADDFVNRNIRKDNLPMANFAGRFPAKGAEGLKALLDPLRQKGQIDKDKALGAADKGMDWIQMAGGIGLGFIQQAIQWANNPGNQKPEGLHFGKSQGWTTSQEIWDKVQAGAASDSAKIVKNQQKGLEMMGGVMKWLEKLFNKPGVLQP